MSTGGAAELALNLYIETGNSSYLTFANQALNWIGTTLQTKSGLIYDHIDTNGYVQPIAWTYNQALYMGGKMLAYQATGNRQNRMVLREKSASAALRR